MNTTLRGLYGITDSQLMPDDESLLRQVEAALRGGMKLLQYRDKSSDQSKRIRQSRLLLTLCHQYAVPLLINDDYQLAAKIGADGVHLGRSDGAIATARALLGDSAIIGSTCHGSLTFAKEAADAGADYLAFGACFPSTTKPNAETISLSTLQAASQQFQLPVVAIGGIRVDNAAHTLTAGADMLAVVQQLFGAPSVYSTARQFSMLFNHSIQETP